MSVCLSKGLGAPIGSLLLGTTEVINQARRWRKVLGGGMRQAGIICAAAKIALTDNIEKLKIDHQNAQYLADKLSKIKGLNINQQQVSTNMVFVQFDDSLDVDSIADQLVSHDILISANKTVRLVTHLDISKSQIDFFINTLNDIINQSR
jgi:threonine aldolase